jgi:cytochrome P450
VTEISKHLPVVWLCRHLGVPESDADKLIEWTDRMLGQSDPEYREDQSDARSRYAPFGTIAGLEAYEYAAEWAAERRARPVDDVMTTILMAEPDGEPLTDDEFKNFFTVLMIAGQEASRHSISHGVLALMQHPDQLDRLTAEPSLIHTAVEEIVRWASPIYQFRRTATVDVRHAW